MDNLDLFNIIDPFLSLFKYVDFRSISINNKGFILSTFRFTNDDFDVIKKRQEHLDKIAFEHKDMIFKTKILNLNDLKSNWDEIYKTKWNLDLGELVNFNRSFKAPSRKYFSDKDYENNCTIEIIFNVSNPEVIHGALNLISDDIKKKGIKDVYSLINRFHEIQNYGLNDHLFAAYIIPFPLEIYSDTLSFYNNYFYTRFKFHKNLKNQKLYITLFSSDKGVDFKYELELGTDSTSLIELGDSFIQDEIYFRIPKKRYEELGSEIRFNILMEFANLGFLIDYENHLRSIQKDKSDYESLIPPSIFDIFMDINIFDLTNVQNFRECINNLIQDLEDNQEKIKITFDSIKTDFDWLLTQNSISILKGFSIELANKNSNCLYSAFRDLLIIVLHNSIYNNFIQDRNFENKANDIMIKYGYDDFDDYTALLYEEKSLEELQLNLSKIVGEVFHINLSCFNYSNYDNQIIKIRKRQILLPKRYSRCELSIDSELSCYFYLYLNDPVKFNHSTIFITFNRPRHNDQIWEGVNENEIEKISNLLNRVLKFKSISIINSVYLPQSITTQLDINKDLTVVSQEDSKWISQYKFKIKNVSTKFKFDFKNINIFIGKNNMGKSHLLTKCFDDIKSGAIFDYPERVKKFEENHPRLSLDMFYIPEKRLISLPSIEVLSLKKELNQFINSINQLKSESYLRIQGNNIVSENTLDTFWKVPDLLRVIDLCLIYESDKSTLSPEGKLIYNEGKEFFKSLKKIFDSWKSWIEKFLNITINPPEGTERGRKKNSSIDEHIFGTKVSNWNWFGSGTQQLLNLIFLIEFLKFGPTINYEAAKTELNIDNYNSVFNNIYNERNCRILFIDEPEVSLHPSLQKMFFQYLFNASKFIQIFIATQSPFFLNISNFGEELGENINLVLCKESNNRNEPIHRKLIKKNEMILIYDEIFDYSKTEIANFLSSNDFYYLSFKDKELSYDVNNLRMINKLYNYIDQNKDYKYRICELGRSIENFETRMIQNCVFLSVKPNICELNNKTNNLEKVLFGQYLVCPKKKRKITQKLKTLLYLYSHYYDNNLLKENVLCLKEECSKKVLDKLKSDIEENSHQIIKYSSMLILQENIISYSKIETLINLAFEKKILIIAGLEHITLESFNKFIRNLPSDLKNKYFENKKVMDLFENEASGKEIWMNQAIIIDNDKKFSFQLKNVPYYSSKFKENIPIISFPHFSIFKTTIGNLTIFICKDFLVNYPVIDKWMDKYEVDYAIIPSNTSLVNPFIRKFGEIVNFKKNQNKHFFFINVAEFSGSGMFCHNIKDKYEPGEKHLFSVRQEGIQSLKIMSRKSK